MVSQAVRRSLLITVCLLLGLMTLGHTQSGKRKSQEPRGLLGIPHTPSVSSAERRVALVIGNAAYQYTAPLTNPLHDAQDMARVLKDLQFEVFLKTNAPLETMADAIFTFGERLKGGGVGLFYYSGHGLQVKGENYLLPVDANLVREDDIKRKTINARDILDKMDEAKSHFNLVFLDACRNNPFPRSVRAVSRGLAGMSAPTGTLLVFATNPDNVAQDGTGRNGTYTKHLLQNITQPGLEVGMLLRRVRTAVREETGGQQVPWENGSIEGEFYFNGRSNGPPVTPPIVQPSPTLPAPVPQLTVTSLPPPEAVPAPQSTNPKAEAAFQRGVATLTKGTYDQAITAFTETLMLTPKRVEAYHNRGEAYRLQGDYNQALADYHQALVLNPNYARSYYARGIVRSDKGAYDEALADYTQALTLNPSFTEAYVSRGIAYDRKRDYDRAIADYNQALVLEPKHAEAYMNRGMAYKYKREYDRAIADYTQAITFNPSYATAYVNRGVAYDERNELDRAIADYDQALALRANFPEAYVNRGAAYHRKGAYDRAIADFTQAIALNPNLAPAYYNRGTSSQKQGDSSRALRDYTQALTLNPRYIAAYVDRGTAYTDQGNYDRAIADFTQALTLSPNYAAAYYHRAVAQFFQKNYTKAWDDVNRFQQAGGKPDPQFLRDLRQASGRGS